MNISMQLAEQIAKACGLPSLYIGEFNGLEINYIWTMTFENAWSSPFDSIIFISSNKWLRALGVDWRKEKASYFLELGGQSDPIMPLFKEHQDFPDPDGLLDGYALRVNIFEKGDFRDFSVAYPNDATTSKQLLETYEKLFETMREQYENNQNIIAQNFSIRDNIQSDFSDLLRYSGLFGLSGLFEEIDAPHDLEYILELRQGTYYYVFVKTRRWFRGVKLHAYYPKSPILELSPVEVNWKELILKRQPKAYGFTAWIRLLQKAGTLKEGFKDLLNSDIESPLWDVLRPLMKQLNQE